MATIQNPSTISGKWDHPYPLNGNEHTNYFSKKVMGPRWLSVYLVNRVARTLLPIVTLILREKCEVFLKNRGIDFGINRAVIHTSGTDLLS